MYFYRYQDGLLSLCFSYQSNNLFFTLEKLWSPTWKLAPSKGIPASLGFHAVDSGFQVLNSSVGFRLGFRIPIVSEILGSSNWIPDSKVQDSGFHKQQFPRFQNPNSLTWGGKSVLYCYSFKRPSARLKTGLEMGGQAVQNGCYELLNGSRKLFNKQ